jgi:hypothetical protein
MLSPATKCLESKTQSVERVAETETVSTEERDVESVSSIPGLEYTTKKPGVVSISQIRAYISRRGD